MIVLGIPRSGEAIGTFDFHAQGWLGNIPSAFREYSTGDLVVDSVETWSTGPATWTDWDNDTLTPLGNFYYYHPEIDIGVDATIEPIVSAGILNATLSVFERHAGGDHVFSDRALLDGVLTGVRYLEIYMVMTTSGWGRVQQTIGALAAQRVEEDFIGLDTSTLLAANGTAHTVGDFRAPITKPFSMIREVHVVFNNTGQAATYELADYNNTIGPHIRIYDSTGALFDANLNIYLRGV